MGYTTCFVLCTDVLDAEMGRPATVYSWLEQQNLCCIIVSMISDFQDEQEFMLVLGLWMTLSSRSTYLSVARMAPLMGCLLSPEVKLGGACHRWLLVGVSRL
jgi:formate-dependent nitrite reductase membrane component NrfD